MNKLAFSLLIIAVLVTALVVTAAATKLYSVVPAGTLHPHEYVSVSLTVPSRSCDTCENIVGIRYGSYDYMVVGYNHPDSGPKLAVWIGQVTSSTESWSQETWAESATAGSTHNVVIKHLGSTVAFYLDGRQVYQVSVGNSAVTIVANGVTVPPPQSHATHAPNTPPPGYNDYLPPRSNSNALILIGAGVIALLVIAIIINTRGHRRR